MTDESTLEPGEGQLPEPPELTSLEELGGEGEGAAKPGEGAGEGEGTPAVTPSPRTYTEQEWNQRQSKLDTQISDMKKTHATEMDGLNQAIEQMRKDYASLAEQREDEAGTSFVKGVEEAGGDVNIARSMVAMQKDLRRQMREFEDEKRQHAKDKSDTQAAMKIVAAHNLAKEHEVDVEELLKANSPTEMENIALKLVVEKTKAGAKPPVRTDSGVPSAKGTDLSDLSAEERIRWAAEHEWDKLPVERERQK